MLKEKLNNTHVFGRKTVHMILLNSKQPKKIGLKLNFANLSYV